MSCVEQMKYKLYLERTSFKEILFVGRDFVAMAVVGLLVPFVV